MSRRLANVLLTLLVVTGLAVPVAPLGASSLPLETGGAPTRMIVSFDHNVGAGTIDRLAAAGVLEVAIFDAVDAAAIAAPSEVIGTLGTWADVTSIETDDPVVAANDGA